MDMKKNSGVKRICISLPESLSEELDRIMAESSFQNRSNAVAEMLRDALITRREKHNDREVMAGSITIFYDESRNQIQERLVEIQRAYLKEVVSSLNVMLENNYRMEVLIVQGPVYRLRALVQELIGCKGVETGKLTLTGSTLPPLHARKKTR
ncbi:CopG family transcriptional regulator [Geotalea uraniireducens]|uniref:CopG family transcriptional regulator n=1 Tax=Geotalea uraniireducens TaxID=351604 RepID=A0ABM8EFG4_9BACT|nr:nickel-responsive transcriptional regulator NikR [Geotalea uraniireducens]BDV41137.1 CopG family transcriptional regulator [Geotalea uraniireducens]